MSLTLIQDQVLEALARAATAGDRHHHDPRAVHPSAVRAKLLDRRSREVSERYVRLILRELAASRIDGLPIVREEHLGRGRRGFAILNTGIRYAWSTQRGRLHLEEDRRRWDELDPIRRAELSAAGWQRSTDGLWRHPDHLDPRRLI